VVKTERKKVGVVEGWEEGGRGEEGGQGKMEGGGRRRAGGRRRVRQRDGKKLCIVVDLYLLVL
jgi:hypothetical protein